jgi:hypothetical protein
MGDRSTEVGKGIVGQCRRERRCEAEPAVRLLGDAVLDQRGQDVAGSLRR